MYKITVEKYDDNLGWHTVTKSTNPQEYLKFISLSGLARLLNIGRGALRYELKI